MQNSPILGAYIHRLERLGNADEGRAASYSPEVDRIAAVAWSDAEGEFKVLCLDSGGHLFPQRVENIIGCGTAASIISGNIVTSYQPCDIPGCARTAAIEAAQPLAVNRTTGKMAQERGR